MWSFIGFSVDLHHLAGELSLEVDPGTLELSAAIEPYVPRGWSPNSGPS
jgi:hypothetical protein